MNLGTRQSSGKGKLPVLHSGGALAPRLDQTIYEDIVAMSNKEDLAGFVNALITKLMEKSPRNRAPPENSKLKTADEDNLSLADTCSLYFSNKDTNAAWYIENVIKTVAQIELKDSSYVYFDISLNGFLQIYGEDSEKAVDRESA